MFIRKKSVAGLAILLFSGVISAETVGIFSDTTIGQIKFAAGDIKTALEAKALTVEILPLTALTGAYANKKVVLALASNSAVTGLLSTQGGSSLPANQGEQAYALRTTTQGQTSYWILGGDINGAMYGGLQVAENISFDGFGPVYNTQETPFMANRGMKLNMPLDRRIPTYVGGWSANSTKLSIPHVWDMNFWKTLIDKQARARYNLLSVWVHHPFPALVKLTGTQFENIALPKIEGFDGYDRPDLTHDARVKFWKDVMSYAHSRGMKFYFFHWNIALEHAMDVNKSITEKKDNNLTKEYMHQSMKALMETYPDLDGWGVSAGDNMTGEAGFGSGFGDADNRPRADWLWSTVGSAIYDHLKSNPGRKFNFIHRGIYTSPELVEEKFGNLRTLGPNVTLNYSVKYAQAHMYSTPTPKWAGMDYFGGNGGKNIRTFMTVRNDCIFYLHWGDPKFVRDYMKGVPNKAGVDGFYIGADTYTPSKTYFYKDKAKNTMIEVERRWYMELLWGRLGYNHETSDNVFINLLKKQYPNIPNSQNLFTAWSLASRGIPKASEMLIGNDNNGKNWSLDYQWWPETNLSEEGGSAERGGTGFRKIDDYISTGVARGSEDKLCDIPTTAKNGCGTKKTSYVHANEMLSEALTALRLANTLGTGVTNDEKIAIENIKQMAYIGSYLGNKIKGATFKSAGNNDSARSSMAQAYCNWMLYKTSMSEWYKPDTMRSMKINGWTFGDAIVLKEYNDLGGTGTPNCADIMPSKLASPNQLGAFYIHSMTDKKIQFSLPQAASVNISIYNSAGKILLQEKAFSGKQGLNDFQISKKLDVGLHFVRIKAGNLSVVEKVKFAVLK
jgi:hypothetical protein